MGSFYDWGRGQIQEYCFPFVFKWEPQKPIFQWAILRVFSYHKKKIRGFPLLKKQYKRIKWTQAFQCPPQVLRFQVWRSLCDLFAKNHQCLPWWEPPPLFFAKKVFLFLGFGISWMSITWIVLCFLASQSKKAWHQLPMSNIVQCELQKTKFTQKTRNRNQTIFSFLIIRLKPFTCRGKLLISIKFVLFWLFSLSLQNHRYQVLEKNQWNGHLNDSVIFRTGKQHKFAIWDALVLLLLGKHKCISLIPVHCEEQMKMQELIF